MYPNCSNSSRLDNKKSYGDYEYKSFLYLIISQVTIHRNMATHHTTPHFVVVLILYFCCTSGTRKLLQWRFEGGSGGVIGGRTLFKMSGNNAVNQLPMTGEGACWQPNLAVASVWAVLLILAAREIGTLRWRGVSQLVRSKLCNDEIWFIKSPWKGWFQQINSKVRRNDIPYLWHCCWYLKIVLCQSFCKRCSTFDSAARGETIISLSGK